MKKTSKHRVINSYYQFNYYIFLFLNGFLGSLVISTYVPCEDVRLIITPDLKGPRQNCENKEASYLIFVDLSGGQRRLGGSALAQCYGQLGDNAPDLSDPSLLKKGFKSIQKLIKSKTNFELRKNNLN